MSGIEAFDARPSADGFAIEIGMFDEQGVCHDCIRLTPTDALAFSASLTKAIQQVLSSTP